MDGYEKSCCINLNLMVRISDMWDNEVSHTGFRTPERLVRWSDDNGSVFFAYRSV